MRDLKLKITSTAFTVGDPHLLALQHTFAADVFQFMLTPRAIGFAKSRTSVCQSPVPF